MPPAVPDKFAEDEPFLTALHHALMEIEILEGQLVCPETCAYAWSKNPARNAAS